MSKIEKIIDIKIENALTKKLKLIKRESTKAFQQAIDFCKQLRIEIRRRQEAEEENEALKRRIELLEEALFESQEKLNKTLVFLNTTSGTFHNSYLNNHINKNKFTGSTLYLADV